MSIFSCHRHAATAALIALALSGCGNDLQRSPDTAQVMLSLAVVPADVQCLRVTAVGPGRTAVREFEVPSGQAFSEALSGLPLGTIVFTGEAFAASCDALTRTTHGSWVSDEVSASVVLGRQASVALTMHRNGRVKVGVDFADEPACAAASASCQTNSECCGHSCAHGQCAAESGADAGPGVTSPDAG